MIEGKGDRDVDGRAVRLVGRMPSNPDGFDPPRNPQINGSQGACPATGERAGLGRSPYSAFSRDHVAGRGRRGLHNLHPTRATLPHAYRTRS